MKLADFRIGTKLVAAFCVVVAIGAAVGGFGLLNLRTANESANTVYEREMLGLSYIKEANIDLLYIGRDLRNAILATSAEARAKALSKSKEHMVTAKAELARAQPLYQSPAGQAEFGKLMDNWAVYEKEVAAMEAKIASQPLGTNTEAVTHLFGPFAAQVNVVDEALTALTKRKEDNAARAVATNNQAYQFSLALTLGLIGLSVALGVGLGMFIARAISRDVKRASDAAARMAEGDMTGSISADGRDETADLLRALQTMQAKLSGTVGTIRSGAEAVATASSQIAQGNLDLSSRTEQQASSLEETAASMEELGATVRQNADSAKTANQLAMSASSVAIEGGEVVSQVVETMKGINDASKRISDIISVIDGIAFQTNILALNAAVEAARAGEQGRGFAVVAGEVRSLAQRSADAAKEIKTLINASVDRVEAGTALVDKAGFTMNEVVSSIRRVTDIMSEISAASNEQSAGVTQVGEAVTQMDRVTQQNAALVEESAAAADALRNQAQGLVQSVSFFKLGQGGGSMRAATVPQHVTPPKVSSPGVGAFTAARSAAPKRAAVVPKSHSYKAPAPSHSAGKGASASSASTPPSPAEASAAAPPASKAALAAAAAEAGEWETF